MRQPATSGCSPTLQEFTNGACVAELRQIGFPKFMSQCRIISRPDLTNVVFETGPPVISLRIFLITTLLLTAASAASAQTCTATVDKTEKICSPASGATVTSPVTFSAGARDTSHPVTAMIMYIDSVKKAQSSNASLSAIISLPAGTHAIVVRAWDSTGFFFPSSESITVATSPTLTP